MKPIRYLLWLLPLWAVPAGAAGVDLDLVACAGASGAAYQANVDCAGGGTFPLFVTFAPAEAISDLVALDTFFDLTVPGGDVTTLNANFWDFANSNAGAMQPRHLRPASGCGAYLDTWNATNAGEAFGANVIGPTLVRMAATVYRPTGVGVSTNQKLFGCLLLLNTLTSLEAGGTHGGCTRFVTVRATQATPASASGSPTTTLTGPNLNTSAYVSLNDVPVPTTRRTWGRLQSLYR